MKTPFCTIKLFLHKALAVCAILNLSILASCENGRMPVNDNFEYAKTHVNDLRISVYCTAHTIEQLFSSEPGRREAVSLMRANGITKVYLEVYRGGLVVSTDLLAEVIDYFKTNGFEVTGGIATVPGGDFGVHQEGKLGWFNWQNPKTRHDLKQVMHNVSPLFDTFIVDDFLCTGDTSLESKSAKGAQSWSVYRRNLLTELATSIFIGPARSVNPDIHMIIKYPQWYDRFHMFGYDVESGPKLFDEVWVGTETRGQYTQRFGFVQPYEGFVNYRWLASLSGAKTGGAWFDHGDCNELDFVEQAYQSVLAGAPELVIFNYESFVQGHPGHHLLRMDLEKLFSLAKVIKSSPVQGIPGYKPPHSDAGGDLYIMDFIGMLGVPLVPVSSYPQNAKTIFLPTQAAADPDIVTKVKASHDQGATIIMTAGFLAHVEDQGHLSGLAGIAKPALQPFSVDRIFVNGSEISLTRPLDMEAPVTVSDAEEALKVKPDDRYIPFLTKSADGRIFVLNSHTFSEADFEAAGEVLLCPRPLGLLDLPQDWINTIRSIFNHDLGIEMDAPARVTLQPLENGSLVLHNYNQEAVTVKLKGMDFKQIKDAFGEQEVIIEGESIDLKMKPRSRVWLREK